MLDSWQTVGVAALGLCQGGREEHSPEKTSVPQKFQSQPITTHFPKYFYYVSIAFFFFLTI